MLVFGLFLTIANFTGTLSYFSDVEESEGNILEAGDLDLQLGLEWEKVCRFNICDPCNPCEVVDSWELDDIKGRKIFDVDGLYEGVGGVALLKLHLFGNPGWASIEMDLTSNQDGFCGILCNGGHFDGDLAQNTHMIIWEDYDADGEREVNERILFDGTMGDFPMDENLDGDYLTEGIQAFENCRDYYVGIEWKVECSSCSDKLKILGDSLTFDILFKAYQRRNQNEYYSEDRAYFDIESSIGNTFVAWWSCDDEDDWDKSSLEFQDSWHDEVDVLVKAEIKNGNDSEDMAGPTTWELYYSSWGNPKLLGNVVDSGTVPALDSGESAVLESDAVGTHGAGNYMFKAYQRPGHPGLGVLWSEEIEVEEA